MTRSPTAFRSSRWLAILTVAVAVTTDSFVYSIVVPILPAILEQRAHVAPHRVQFWISALLASYSAAMVVCAPIFGYVADHFSSKKLLMLMGLLMLATSTALFALSMTIPLLVLARVLQGISAAVVWAAGLALLVQAMDPAEVGFAMGWVSLAVSLGGAAGPFVGALAYERAGHNATFSIVAALVAVDMLLRFFYVPTKRAKASMESASNPSTSQSATAPPSDMNAGLHSTSTSSNDVDEETALLGTTQVANAAPRVPAIFQILGQSHILFSLWCIFVVYSVDTGLEAILPLHVEAVFGWSTQGAGFMYLAMVAPIFFGPLVGRMYDRVGNVPLTTAGMILTTIGCLGLAYVHGSQNTDVVLIGASLFVAGAGIMLVMTTEMAEISSFAETKELESPGCFGPSGATGQCCALINVCFALAGVVGPAATGAVQTFAGWAPTTLMCGGAAFAALLTLAASKRFRVKLLPFSS